MSGVTGHRGLSERIARQVRADLTAWLTPYADGPDAWCAEAGLGPGGRRGAVIPATGCRTGLPTADPHGHMTGGEILVGLAGHLVAVRDGPPVRRVINSRRFPAYHAGMADWRRGAGSAFWAVDRVLGGQRPPTRLQKWVGRHPVRAGASVGVPAACLLALVLLLDGAEPAEVVVGVLLGLLLGLVFGLTAAAERLRQRRLRRLGVWDGA